MVDLGNCHATYTRTCTLSPQHVTTVKNLGVGWKVKHNTNYVEYSWRDSRATSCPLSFQDAEAIPKRKFRDSKHASLACAHGGRRYGTNMRPTITDLYDIPTWCTLLQTNLKIVRTSRQEHIKIDRTHAAWARIGDKVDSAIAILSNRTYTPFPKGCKFLSSLILCHFDLFRLHASKRPR